MSDAPLLAATNEPADSAVRAEALDPGRSFIVQAPAGSGKTELLTRRVLRLLTLVDEPEEVLSITFTRKAASEMRARVVETLQQAATGVEPENAYQLEGFKLAQLVLIRDKERDWQLLQNTQRLNLRTIDALCTTLAHRLPIVSQLGGPAGLIDNPQTLYRRAAEQVLDQQADKLDLLLLQLSNRHEHVQYLLAELLGNRDQWSGYVNNDVPHEQLRELLESKLQQLIENRLEDVSNTIPIELAEKLVKLLSQAGPVLKSLLAESGQDTAQDTAKADSMTAINGVPNTSVEDLPAWQAISDAVLTASPPVGLRKPGGVTKKIGFPVSAKDADLVGVPVAELKARKASMAELLGDLAHYPELVDVLDDVRSLPSGRYADKDWALLSQLLTMLPALLTELQIVFADHGAIDFVEMTKRAQRALGTEDAPTDLALALDMKIKHVLVDEFQDTSRTQFALYQLLVAGWEVDDGRTFFAVGDPMQSIYRFREGDVTLFAHAREHGVGDVQLNPLTLSVNFRAAPSVVEWVNNSFSTVFPAQADTVTGAVPYAESIAHLQSTGLVDVHPFVDADVFDEATHVAELTNQALQSAADANGGISGNEREAQTTIAILLRSRSQAGPIFNALQERNIAYQSVDLELLGDRQVVRDLVSLALALRYPHDRLHWLAVLRAPWCGLNLHDLHVLMEESKRETVFDLMHDAKRVSKLSADGRERLEKCLAVLSPAVQRSSRAALTPWVEACWQQLGGPIVCNDQIDLDAAERCITELCKLEQTGQLWQASVLRSSMESLYATSADGDAQVQVMTLHKSKGLEFDTVILPSLDRKPRSNQQRILNWFESGSDADERLLLAPIRERGLSSKDGDPINNLVSRAGQLCDEQEKLRLLYVACTRARRTLHLVARVKTNSDGELSSPDKRSLLHPLWPLFQERIILDLADTSENEPSNEQIGEQLDEPANNDNAMPELTVVNEQVIPNLHRLPTDWRIPDMNVFVWPESLMREPGKQQEVEFLWAGTLARDVGTVVHDQLRLLSSRPVNEREQLVSDIPRRAKLQLQNLCVPQDILKDAVEKVVRAVDSTLSDDRGCWILSDAHTDARSEWAITAPINGVVKRFVIDRTFIDNDDVRWIIDYKTGDHEGGDREAFLDSEQQRYAEQLQGYTDIIGLMEQIPIKAALYFPLLKGWREFDPVQLVSEQAMSEKKAVKAQKTKAAKNDSSSGPHQAELF